MPANTVKERQPDSWSRLICPTAAKTDGKPWLHWKNNDGSTEDVSKVWAAPLDASTGTAVAGPVREVMAKNTQLYTWQSTLDNPQMVIANGLH